MSLVRGPGRYEWEVDTLRPRSSKESCRVRSESKRGRSNPLLPVTTSDGTHESVPSSPHLIVAGTPSGSWNPSGHGGGGVLREEPEVHDLGVPSGGRRGWSRWDDKVPVECGLCRFGLRKREGPGEGDCGGLQVRRERLV